MAKTTLAELGDTIPTIIEEALFQREFDTVMRGLCWNIKKGKGSSVNVPYWGTVVASVLSEAVDMTSSETMQDTNVQITPYEVGLKIILTDNVIEDDNEDLKRAAGILLGNAYEKKVDQDLLGQLDDAASSLASSGDALALGHLAAARATLLANTAAGGPAKLPYVAVIHPNHELDLVDVLTPLVPAAGSSYAGAAGPLADEVIRKYSMGRAFGMPIVTDGNIALTAVSAKGGVFASGQRGGIIYVSAREPSIEAERDASARGFELNYVGRFGVGEFLSGWVVELWADATAPA